MPSPFCSNSRTFSALSATVLERFTADVILIQKSSDSQNTSQKRRGSKGSKKKLGSEFGARPPLRRLRCPRRLRGEGHIQVFYAFDSTKSCGDRRHCIKTQTFANVFRHHCSRYLSLSMPKPYF